MVFPIAIPVLLATLSALRLRPLPDLSRVAPSDLPPLLLPLPLPLRSRRGALRGCFGGIVDEPDAATPLLPFTKLAAATPWLEVEAICPAPLLATSSTRSRDDGGDAAESAGPLVAM